MANDHRINNLRSGDDLECSYCDAKAIYRIGNSGVVCCKDHLDLAQGCEQDKSAGTDADTYRQASRGW